MNQQLIVHIVIEDEWIDWRASQASLHLDLPVQFKSKANGRWHVIFPLPEMTYEREVWLRQSGYHYEIRQEEEVAN